MSLQTLIKSLSCFFIRKLKTVNKLIIFLGLLTLFMQSLFCYVISDDGNTVINSNPLKIETGYSTGINVINFTPTYRNFRIYLVVNGSDIGAQFSDATMIINHFKIYQENS